MDSGTSPTETPAPHSEPPLGLQQDDVVRLVDTGELGLVEHVGGDTSEEEEEDIDEEDEFDGFPIPHWSAPYDAAPPGGSPRHFITQYDDDGGADSDTDSDASGPGQAPENRVAVPANGPQDGVGAPESQPPPTHGGDHDGGHEGDQDPEEDGENDGEMHYHLHLHEREEVPVGSARIMLLDSPRDVVLPIEKLRVEDRAFMTGDVVHRSLRYRVAAATTTASPLGPDDASLESQPVDASSSEREVGDSNAVNTTNAAAVSDESASPEQSAIVVSVERRLIVRRVTPRMQPLQPHDTVVNNEPTFEISTDQLSFFSDVREGCYVVRNDWLGRVLDANQVLTVKFSSGARCIVQAHPEAVLPADIPDEAHIEDLDGMYYPGQFVRAQRAVWEEAMWESGTYRNELVGQVEEIRTLDLSVDWIATAYTDEHSPEDAEKPPDEVKASDVSTLTAFRNLSWRVGARGYYKGVLPDFVVRASERMREPGDREEHAVLDDDVMQDTRNDEQQTPGENSVANELHDGQSSEGWVEVDGDDDEDDGEWEEVEDEVHRAELEDATMDSSFESEWVDSNGAVESAVHPPVDVQPGERSRRSARSRGGRILATQRRTLTSHMDVEPHSGRGAPCDNVLEVVNTRTFLDLLWQDGTVSKHVPAVSVLRNNHLGAYDYFPGIFVSLAPDDLDETGGDNQESGEVKKRRGVVARVNPNDRTAFVRWQIGESSEYGPEEEVSVYELSEHGEYDVRLTDTVLRVPGPGSSESIGNRPDWVGEVVGTGIGTVRVAWHGGLVQDVSPDRVLVIVAEDDEDEDMEGETDDDSYETGNADEGVVHPSAGDDAETVNLPDNWQGEEGADAVWSAPGTSEHTSGGGSNRSSLGPASTAISALAGAMAAAAVGVGLVPPDGHVAVAPEVLEEISMHNSAAEKTAAESTPVGVVSSQGHENGPYEASVEASSGEEEALADVDRFEMLDSFERHHFEGGSSSDQAFSPGFPMVVRKEWTRLAQHLPPGIFVHACESRLDLLRAAIIGPSGTPYENAMFFFDIQLPPDYPTTPPRVHFMSHGRRMSPNLYENGKVCLSLLGTWDGDGVEKWDPRNSNLLRVLLSVQAMVLVEEPYYTEAGYEKQVGTEEGRANSLLYNESTMLLTLRHMVSTLRPGGAPQDFADLARMHFFALKERILARCEKLLVDGSGESSAAGGSAPLESEPSAGGGAEPSVGYSSVGFKRSLRSLLPKVRTALESLPPAKQE